MEIYLVGGAVRDALLGYPSSERDWVVVGASPADMLDNGYQQVGRDFPVFLHPQTKDCLLYTSDAADERSSVDLGGRRIIKKKNHMIQSQRTIRQL